MEMIYCRRCGEKLSNINGHVFACDNKHVIFHNSSPATAIILVNERREPLVAVRGIEPGKGKLHVPAGFCDDAEIFEDAIKRELEEELNLTHQDYSEPVFLLSHIDQYEYKNESLPVVTAVFWATIDSSIPFKAADDLSEASYVPYDKLKLEDFQFEAVKVALHRLHELAII